MQSESLEKKCKVIWGLDWDFEKGCWLVRHKTNRKNWPLRLPKVVISHDRFLLQATGLPLCGPEWFHCQSPMPIQKYRHICGYMRTGQQRWHPHQHLNIWTLAAIVQESWTLLNFRTIKSLHCFLRTDEAFWLLSQNHVDHRGVK